MQIHRITRTVQKNTAPKSLPPKDYAREQRQFYAASARADREPGHFAEAAACFLNWRENRFGGASRTGKRDRAPAAPVERSETIARGT